LAGSMSDREDEDDREGEDDREAVLCPTTAKR
jgi:hypothetical protein